jgi:NAD(P)-dependent dehydrogenase (short-subunit alcohol dehydrogenase family)
MQKNVIITGAAGNLGEAAVKKFLALDYTVIVTVSPGKKLGYDTPAPVDLHELDLTDETAVEKFAKRVILAYGGIHAVLLLVGGYASGKTAETDHALISKMHKLNFDTAYFLARPIFVRMCNQPDGGRLIFVGSRPSLIAKQGKNNVAYALAKSLLFKLAEFLNVEGSSSNVVSTVVVPSTIDTPQNRSSNPGANFDDWVKSEAIAEAMAFICSEEGKVLREPVFKVYGNA